MVLRGFTHGLTVCVLVWAAGVAPGCAEESPRAEGRGEGRFPIPTDAQMAAETRQELTPDLAHAYGLAVAGQLEPARAAVQEHLAQPRGRVDAEQALFVLAVVQQRASLNDQARTLLEEVIARRPAFLSAYHHLGLSLCELGDLDGAREAFAVLRARRPEQVNTAYHMGLVALEQGRMDDAEALFAEAVERHRGRNAEQLARGHVGLGDVAQRRGALAAAREHYERAAQIDLTSEQAWYGLNRVLWRMGEEGRAQEAGQRHAHLVAAVDTSAR